MNSLFGFLIGIVASFLAWFVVAHLIVPNLSFAKEIKKITSFENPSGYKYKIDFCNKGWRDIIDLKFVAKLRIQGLIGREPNIWRAIYIPFDDSRIPKMKSHRKKKSHMSIQLLVNQLNDSARACLPEQIQNKLKSRTLILEDLMGVGKNARLQVFAFGYDLFSGTRKVFESIEFDKMNIKEVLLAQAPQYDKE